MRIDYSMELGCTPDQLWPYLEDPQRQKQWMKGLLENTATSEGPQRVGSTFRMRIKEGGKVAEYDGQITGYEKNRYLGIRMWGGALPKEAAMNVDYRLADLNGRTRLDYVCRMEGAKFGWFMRMLMPLFAFFGKMQLKSFMRKLKSLVELKA
jgi:carbon monoxide dehydrogenase subunit G